MQKFTIEMESDVKIFTSDILVALEKHFTDLEFIAVQSGSRRIEK